eukprot:g81358.t1
MQSSDLKFKLDCNASCRCQPGRLPRSGGCLEAISPPGRPPADAAPFTPLVRRTKAGLQIFIGREFYLSLFRFAAATGLRNSVLVRLPTAELFPHVPSRALTRALRGLDGRRALDALRRFLREPLDRRLAEDCPLIIGCDSSTRARLCARLTMFEFLARCSAADGTFDAGALHQQLELHGQLLICTEGAHYWQVPPHIASPRFVPFESLYQLRRQRGIDLRKLFRTRTSRDYDQDEPVGAAYGLPRRARYWFAKAWLDARDRQVALGFLSILDPATGSLGAPPTLTVLRQILLELRFFGDTHGWLRDDLAEPEDLPEYRRARETLPALQRLLRPLNKSLKKRAIALSAQWIPFLLDDCLRRALKHVLGFVLNDRARVIECEVAKYEDKQRHKRRRTATIVGQCVNAYFFF